MPHKRNPVSSENLSGLARLVRSYSIASLENIPLWHERDISHSSVERVIAPDATILIDYMLTRFTSIVKNLIVYPDHMKIQPGEDGRTDLFRSGPSLCSPARAYRGKRPMPLSRGMQ